MRRLVLALGDQLDGASAAFDGFDPAQDAVLQMEVSEEATYVPQHKLRLAFFFAAMRHFLDEQRAKGRRVIYSELDDPENRSALADEARRRIAELRPREVVVLEPGDWRVRQNLMSLGPSIELRTDRHFVCLHETFADFTAEHPRLLLERPFIGRCDGVSAC